MFSEIHATLQKHWAQKEYRVFHKEWLGGGLGGGMKYLLDDMK